MIRPEMAKKFIDQITEYTEYNINIMDESGVIIASRDEKRIGTYHEAADRIIRGKEEIVVIEDDKIYPGVLPGINMAIMVNGRKEGVVGVTGDPGRIHEVAMVTRLAIEAKYEKQQEDILLRQGRKESFFHLLTRVEGIHPSEIRAAARMLEYDESILRIPILCRILDDTSPDRILEAIRANKGHWIQDLSTVIDETHVLVFRTIREPGAGRSYHLREAVMSYLDQTEWLLETTPESFQQEVASKYNLAFTLVGDKKPDFLGAVSDLRASFCAQFNENVPDAENVYYQSVGSKINKALTSVFPLNFSNLLAGRFDGPNDGLVAIDSAKWGDNFTVLSSRSPDGVSHADVIDLLRHDKPDLDIREFYVGLVSGLREKGY